MRCHLSVATFSKMVPAPGGCPETTRSRQLVAMYAPDMEHCRERSDARWNTEHTDRYT